MDISFDTNLFGDHILPFAAYIEPVGYAEIASKQRVQASAYQKWVPQTVEIAMALFACLPQTEKWGKQVIARSGPQWITEVKYGSYMARYGKSRPGKALTAQDLLRALSRPNVYAYGRTDEHVEEREYDPFRPTIFRTTMIDFLCLDVDMDIAWETRDTGMIRQEIALESESARLLGLPYRVFRTGGRGHQAVLPLPTAIDRSAAAWLMTAYRFILEPYHYIDGQRQAHADVSNLNKIVRIVGGRHAKSGRLALWINPLTGNLYELTEQAALMMHGYRHPDGGQLGAVAFFEASKDISDYLESQGIGRFLAPPSPMQEILFWLVVRALPDNQLICRFQNAQDVMDLGGDGPEKESSCKRRRDEALTMTQQPKEWLAPGGLRRWAESQWKVDWVQPGIFWNWISEGGGRGITAAKVLYGEQALDQLLARTHALDAELPSKAQERRRVISTLYSNHQLQIHLNQRAVVGELTEEAKTIIPIVFEALNAHKRIQARNREDIEQVITVLLMAFQQADEGYIDISLDAIRDSIKERWPDSLIDRSTVARHLHRLKENDPACGFSLLQEIIMDRNGLNPASRYRPGSDLRATVWGAGLPYDDCQNANVRTEAMKMRVIKAGKLQTVDVGVAMQRGRKRNNPS